MSQDGTFSRSLRENSRRHRSLYGDTWLYQDLGCSRSSCATRIRRIEKHSCRGLRALRTKTTAEEQLQGPSCTRGTASCSSLRNGPLIESDTLEHGNGTADFPVQEMRVDEPTGVD